MHWKCFFVFKNTCKLKVTSVWLLAAIFATVVLAFTLVVSLYLPACELYDVKEQSYKFEMMETSFPAGTTQWSRIEPVGLVKGLRRNISLLETKLDQLRAMIRIYEKLGKVMEKDSSLSSYGDKLHRNVLISSIPHSGELFLGEIFNQHSDTFYLFEPFDSLKYFRDNRSPDAFASMLHNFSEGIFSCDFANFEYFTDFLSRHYKALLHRLSSRSLSSPPLCPQVVSGRYYNIRMCTRLRPPTISAICKLHSYTVVKTTHTSDLERLLTLAASGEIKSFHVVSLVRDPRAMLHEHLLEEVKCNVTGSFFVKLVQNVCSQLSRSLTHIKTYESKCTNRFIAVKYEELVSNPLETLKNLHRFLGMSFDSRVKSWLQRTFKEGFAWPEFDWNGVITVRTLTNLTKTLMQWRNGLKVWQIRLIERECNSTMRTFGYEKFL